MKILNRVDFLKCPSGTVYSLYKPCLFEGLYIKAATVDGSNDFVMADLIAPVKCTNTVNFVKACKRAESGENVTLDFDIYGRDSCFDRDQLFAVYSPEDVAGLIYALTSQSEADTSRSTPQSATIL